MPSQTPIGIGLIGVGRHGIRYARHIVNDLPNAALVAVCRQHPEQGIDLPGNPSIRMYGDTRALIADPAVEVVIVVTPPIYAREICFQAIRARKPVLIEKPLAASYNDARAMAEAAAHASVPLMTAQTLRFDSIIQTLKDKRALIGHSQQLVLASHIEMKGRGADHADGYGKRGALLEFGIHMLDLVRFMTGEEIREVRCTMDSLPSAAPDTSASVQLTTDGETHCRIDVSRVPAGRVGQVEWIGSEGRLLADWIQRRLRWRRGDGQTEDWTIPQVPTVLATLAAFLEAVRNHTPMPITGKDGCRAVEIAEACYRSAQAGGRTIALPLR